MTLHCGACGVEIKDYHPSADYERVTISTVKEIESGVDRKKLCQVCAAAVQKEFSKYQAGGLYIE